MYTVQPRYCNDSIFRYTVHSYLLGSHERLIEVDRVPPEGLLALEINVFWMIMHMVTKRQKKKQKQIVAKIEKLLPNYY